MNRSRGVMFALVAAGFLAVTGAVWLLAGHQDAGAATGVLPGHESADGGPVVLPDATAEASTLKAADGSAAADAAPGATAATDAPTHTLKGRVRMEDTGPLPEGLRVFASRECPQPVLFTMRDAMKDQGRGAAMGSLFGDDGADLRAAQRSDPVAVAPDGRFELPAAANEDWIGVVGEGVYVNPSVRAVAGAQDDLDVVLVRGAVLAGRVVDTQGAPRAGCRVRAATPFDPYGMFDSSSHMATLGSVTADEHGAFVFPQVPTGVGLQVVARASGPSGDDEAPAPAGPALQSARLAVPALQTGERRVIELVQRLAGSVSGHVARADGTPVAAAKVMLRHSSFSMQDMGAIGADAAELRAKTGDDGAFTFPRVADGSYEAVLAQHGFRLTHSAGVTVESGAAVQGVSLLAETGLAVSGRVLDPDGQPVAGAQVSGYPPPGMMSFGGAFDRGLRPDETSAADGTYRLEGFDPGKVRVEAYAKGFRRMRQDVDAGATDVELKLSRLTSVSGIVVSLTDGEPVKKFDILMQPAEGLFRPGEMFGADAGASFERIARGHFEAREDGTFTIEDVTPGNYDASVTAEGFGAHTEKTIEVPDGGRRGLVVMLEPEAAVLGTVVDGKSGAPVVGAVVRTSGGSSILELMNSMVQPTESARSDAQGRFRLGGLSAGQAHLAIEHPDYRTLGLTDIALTEGEQHDLGILRLSKGAAVFGTVFDGLGTVPNVSIMVSNATGSTIKRTTSDGQGHFRVEGLPPGAFNVMRMDFSMSTGADASPTDMLKNITYEQVTLAEDEERRVDLRVHNEGGSSLTGIVSDAAGPVAGAVLTLVPESPGARLGLSTSDKEGHYEISHVSPGHYELSVATAEAVGPAQGVMGSATLAALDLAGGGEQHHDIVLPGGVLNGVVVSKKDGHTVPEVRVVLLRTDDGLDPTSFLKALGGRVGETYSGKDGGFRFRHIAGGTYSLLVGGKGLLGTGASGWTAKRVEGLSVLEGSPGFTQKVEVEPAAVVAGTVTDIGGTPISGVGVWVLDATGTPRSVFSEVLSDANGAYEVGDLQAGAWSLAFMDGGHALTIVPNVMVQPEQRTPLNVSLPPGVSLRLNLSGRLAGSVDVSVAGQSGPLPARLLSLNDLAGMPTGAGTLSVGTFAPGSYHLVVLSGGAPLLDTSVVLSEGSGPKILDLPPP